MYDDLIKRLRREAVYLPEKFSKNAELLDVLMKAADAIEELEKQLDEETEYATALSCYVPQWIPVTERLPENHDYYLVYIIGGEYDQISWTQIAFFDSRYFHLTGVGVIARVTHWAYLPEPPKESEP